MYPILIETVPQYAECRRRGFSPLIDRRFSVALEIRIAVQRHLFPSLDEATNQRFYRWVWDNWPTERRCEETGRPLHKYAAVHISHIITKAYRPEMKYDTRNINLLTWEAHNKWDQTATQKKRMFIYRRNRAIAEQLLQDYNINVFKLQREINDSLCQIEEITQTDSIFGNTSQNDGSRHFRRSLGSRSLAG